MEVGTNCDVKLAQQQQKPYQDRPRMPRRLPTCGPLAANFAGSNGAEELSSINSSFFMRLSASCKTLACSATTSPTNIASTGTDQSSERFVAFEGSVVDEGRGFGLVLTASGLGPCILFVGVGVGCWVLALVFVCWRCPLAVCGAGTH